MSVSPERASWRACAIIVPLLFIGVVVVLAMDVDEGDEMGTAFFAFLLVLAAMFVGLVGGIAFIIDCTNVRRLRNAKLHRGFEVITKPRGNEP